MIVRKHTRRRFLKSFGAASALSYYHDAAYAEEDQTVVESAREIPVVYTCDVCVIGGGCTGVFAAVRAARMGAKVALVENNGYFGGVATAGLVNYWHSIYNTDGTQQIIGGLTQETIERLDKRNEVVFFERTDPSKYVALNSPELAIEFDTMVRENDNIRPFLHTRFVQPVSENGEMSHAIIEDKTGRRAIKAGYFIDSSGDGDVISRMGLPFTKLDDIQPPTACALVAGMREITRNNRGFDLGEAVFDPKLRNSLNRGFIWNSNVVGLPGTWMIAGTRIHSADCSDADNLTYAEMEGRRQIRVIRDILHDNYTGGESVSIVDIPSYIGIRETRHATCLHQLSEDEVLHGLRFPDAIANGSYRVDVHHSEKSGITLRYLDGREVYTEPGQPAETGRWREPSDINPTFYQIPYRSLVPQGSKNVLVAGRLTCADRGAYGAIRVMVNCNQTGEAAGIACALALAGNTDVNAIDTDKLRKTMEHGGSVII